MFAQRRSRPRPSRIRRLETASRHILGTRVDRTTYLEATGQILRWAQYGESKAVFAANVHMVMEGVDNVAFQAAVNRADLVTADGVPLAWGLRLLTGQHADRVYGPALMLEVCRAAESAGVPIGLYGGKTHVLDRLHAELQRRFPQLVIAYCYSPPHRPLSREEDDDVVESMRLSGARILFVALGCPKQEYWTDQHRDRLHFPIIAVGAAFDFIAGEKKQAPPFLQGIGMEWAFRLAVEPRRLWKRYLKHNPRFMAYFFFEFLVTSRIR